MSNTILEHYEQLRKKHPSLNPLREGRLSCSSKTTQQASEVIEALQQFDATDGWITLPSANLKIHDWNSTPQSGIPLSAELCKAQQSLHLRYHGNHWELSYYDQSQGEPVLVETRQLASTTANETLNYHIFWHHQEDQGYQASTARFTGFHPTKETAK